MKNWRRDLCVTTLLLILTSANCSTLANYFLPPLNKRHLRVSKDGPFTEYRWFEKYGCGIMKLGTCYREHIERDFDFTKAEDRARFNDMGFDCSVREMPR